MNSCTAQKEKRGTGCIEDKNIKIGSCGFSRKGAFSAYLTDIQINWRIWHQKDEC